MFTVKVFQNFIACEIAWNLSYWINWLRQRQKFAWLTLEKCSLQADKTDQLRQNQIICTLPITKKPIITVLGRTAQYYYLMLFIRNRIISNVHGSSQSGLGQNQGPRYEHYYLVLVHLICSNLVNFSFWRNWWILTPHKPYCSDSQFLCCSVIWNAISNIWWFRYSSSSCDSRLIYFIRDIIWFQISGRRILNTVKRFASSSYRFCRCVDGIS